jgi:hypothetical protein
MNNFDDIVRKYYSSKTLSAEKVEDVLSKSTRSRKVSFTRSYQLAGLAVALLIGFVFLHQRLNQATMTERVMAEIAMNHQEQLSLEVTSDQYQVVQEKLSRLDFSILPDKSDMTQNYTLVGGRYCSIHGELAVQLKLQDKTSGKLISLYVTNLTDELKDMTPLDADLSGVNIQFWKQNGRFFASASDREVSG